LPQRLSSASISCVPSPAPVQTATAREIEASAAVNLADFLNRRIDGVYVNEVQGNPFQPDVNYRGYTASPLLGTPQGLSFYMDGVRLNQPFGDVVSWDLIPRIAISEISLIPGSNPVFGLNTLGGALSMETKDGRRDSGATIQVSGGSFGRKTAELEYGGSNSKGLSWFGATSLFLEDGWRTASPSNVRQFFGKLGWQGGNTALGLTVSYANNSLTGNGLQDQRLLANDFASVYTIPDQTANRSPFLSLNGRRSIRPALSLAANAYYRYIRTATLNGDINEDSLKRLTANLRAAGVEPRASIVTADMRKLPFEDASFDGIVSAYAVDHLGRDGVKQTLAEAARVLKPGGEFLLVIVNGRDPWLRFAFGPLLAHGGFRGASWWEDRMRESGLQVEETGTSPGSFYMVVKR
jgi:SAM-dependent methyltransferase